MNKFNTLSIAENGGLSDVIAGRQTGSGPDGTYSISVSISVERELRIDCSRIGPRPNLTMFFPNFDIPGLIQFLQDAQTFISEEEMVKTLLKPNATHLFRS